MPSGSNAAVGDGLAKHEVTALMVKHSALEKEHAAQKAKAEKALREKEALLERQASMKRDAERMRSQLQQGEERLALAEERLKTPGNPSDQAEVDALQQELIQAKLTVAELNLQNEEARHTARKTERRATLG